VRARKGERGMFQARAWQLGVGDARLL
jgi:hypothetical protein